MTEVRKPGSHGKVASILLFSDLKTQTVSHQCFIDFQKILSITLAT